MNMPRCTALAICAVGVLATLGCNDDHHRDGPKASHAHPQDTPSRPYGESATPSKTDTQAKVAGTPSDAATPAPAGQPAGAAPSKTTETNKVSGAPNDTAQPNPQPENTRAVPPEKSPSGGKDATP